MPEQPVLTVRTITVGENLPAFFSDAYGKIARYLAELGELPAGMPFAAYSNMDMRVLEVEAGFPVVKPLSGKEDVQNGSVKAGKFGVTLHIGSYDPVGPAYDALTTYIQLQGYEPTGIAYEYYLNAPEDDLKVEPRTEIRLQLK